MIYPVDKLLQFSRIHGGLFWFLDSGFRAAHYPLPKYLRKEPQHAVRLEKRAVSIIVPGFSCNTGLEVLGILPLEKHHDQLCNACLSNILSEPIHPNHKIRNLLHPTRCPNIYNLRKHSNFELPNLKTNRARNSFIYAPWLRRYNCIITH